MAMCCDPVELSPRAAAFVRTTSPEEAAQLRKRQKEKRIDAGTYVTVYECGESEVTKIDDSDLLNCSHGLREVAITMLFRHPNLASAKTITLHVDGHGDTALTKRCKKAQTRLPEIYAGSQWLEWRKSVLYQCLRALRVLHSADIVHGDVKFANLLVFPTRRDHLELVALGDFGLSAVVGSVIRPDIMCTLNFRPPEIMYGYNKVSTAIDIFSVGMVACTMLGILDTVSGRDFTEHECALHDIHGVCYSEYNNTVEYTVDLDTRKTLATAIKLATTDNEELDFIMKCLEPYPSMRPTASQAMRLPYFSSVREVIEKLYPEPKTPYAHEGAPMPLDMLDSATCPICWRVRKLMSESDPQNLYLALTFVERVMRHTEYFRGLAEGAVLLSNVFFNTADDYSYEGDVIPAEAQEARKGALGILDTLGGRILTREVLHTLAEVAR